MIPLVHHHFESLESTQGWAKSHLSSLARGSLTVVSCDEQTGGYGQFRRQWVSPPKTNIAVTFCFHLGKQREDLIYVAQNLSISVASVITRMGIKPQFKWPNDLLIDGKKVSGAICETVFEDQHVLCIAGVGVNVNADQSAMDAIDQPATSLSLISGKQHNTATVLDAIIAQVRADVSDFLNY